MSISTGVMKPLAAIPFRGLAYSPNNIIYATSGSTSLAILHLAGLYYIATFGTLPHCVQQPATPYLLSTDERVAATRHTRRRNTNLSRTPERSSPATPPQSTAEMCQISMTVCESCSHIYRVHLHQCGPVLAHLPQSEAFTVADFFWSPFNGCEGMLFCRPVKVEDRCFACMDDTDIVMAVDLEDDGDEIVGEKPEGEDEVNGWHVHEVENHMGMAG